MDQTGKELAEVRKIEAEIKQIDSVTRRTDAQTEVIKIDIELAKERLANK